ncbi:hypothetical protein RvY_03916 [Ramazzottius varieornatus]|uniref:Peptidase S8/S53 domain-containing protein n=1 Tax=Ramazzottius varieornatus TaxID=947166 RepID=A0A1D1UQI9_RAMVA|nr:hypothetical protein RvY_03916 [Ramazzottius varieornatus]
MEAGLYPFEGLIPKRETGAFDFLRKYPDYDGRGIKMAIFDSGVDPGAEGLQVTSTGLPKIVDIHDASGAGDIDTSTTAELDSEGCLKGISGRKLVIQSTWKNPTSKWHLGLIKLFSVVSQDFHGAWQTARKLQRWTPKHAEVTAAALNKSPSGDATTEMAKEEREAQQEVLKMLDEKYEDLGPVMDVVVFHDGQQWWAAVDTLESGDLSQATLLTNYCDQRKYGTIG